ncbi:MAG TPA: UDP-N-acetylmuramate:L-alanyl-gamma-D-glutamyl-meso-diaminopimelate ligase [Candidatus Binatia bacterium]|nr:UDP-N-acetylmuramate:L-alanyl-gamma-D-glutamyl-meso-diaminopimelate ligase [Candidatus Binatia bacterium]
MSDFPAPGSHIHLIAVCGVGMASLAGLLQSRGYRVTGSDQNVYPPMSTYLEEIGIDVVAGFHADHLVPRPDLVVVGNAVSRTNPEAQAVLAQHIPHVSFPQALGEFLIGARKALVVAGTHGKTTTTALAAWVFKCAGLDPGFFVGGVPVNLASGWNIGAGDHVVIEGDEYDTAFFDKGPKFLHYRPGNVILTSVEFDHADIYRDLAHVKRAFLRLMEIIPPDGSLVFCGDYPIAGEIAAAARCRRVSYGDGSGNDWSAVNLEFLPGRTFFEPCYGGKSDGRIEVGLIGRHNVKNALAVYALSRAMGIERANLLDGFASFRGVKRRQEIRGERRGVLVMDDFAHHPTAVRDTIEAVRSAYSGRRLWAIFEPRSNTSKRNIFEKEFAAALGLADRIVVASVYQPEKIADSERLSVHNVVTEINRQGGGDRARNLANAEAIAAAIGREALAGDLVLVMSNGGFDNVQEKILQALAR